MQFGKIHQFDDGNQDAHEIDLKHPPLAQVVIATMQQHPQLTRNTQLDGQQNEQLA
ncbi:hypothetical protein D3C80_2193790 [compost metagenome]